MPRGHHAVPRDAVGLLADTMSEHETQEPILAARVKCAEWLAGCIRLGWAKDHLDALETLRWRWHDHTGALTP